MEYEQLQNIKADLASLEKHPRKNRDKINYMKGQIQAAEQEAAINPRTTLVVQQIQTDTVYTPKYNNYPDYPSMVQESYDMFLNKSKFGGEIYGALVDSRVAFTGGEGVSVTSDNKKVQKWARGWIKANKLDGVRNIRFLETGELEGKNLVVLNKTMKPPRWLNQGKPYVSATAIPWGNCNYNVKRNDKNSDIIESITYKEKGAQGAEKTISADTAVYVQLGGTDSEYNNTVNGMLRSLTASKNASRALYDLRRVGNLFGFPKQIYKVDLSKPGAQQTIKTIENHFKAGPVPPNEAYIGGAEFNYGSPGRGGVETLLEDLKAAFRILSLNTGLPIHFLAWPELMSNRATAENLLELINNKTKTPRLIWEDSYTEMLYKARVMTIDDIGPSAAGIEAGEIEAFLNADIQVKLPLATMSQLQQIVNVWMAILDVKGISMETFRNMLPGIDPALEKKLVKKEKEENIKDAQRTINQQPGNTGNENTGEPPGAQDDVRGNQLPGSNGDVPANMENGNS